MLYHTCLAERCETENITSTPGINASELYKYLPPGKGRRLVCDDGFSLDPAWNDTITCSMGKFVSSIPVCKSKI